MNPQANLIPREPKRMKQPRKAALRDELIRAVEVIEAQRAYIEHMRRPWWHRIFTRTQT